MDGEHAQARVGTTSRFAVVSRRSILAALALGAGGALAACSDGDQAALGATQDESDAGSTDRAGQPAVEGAVPEGAAVDIRFAFAVADQGRGPARNPYIAVWIESPAEEMVTTIAVWHLQENERWLGELKRWYTVAGGGDQSVSGATRVPGEYAVQWNCTDASGSRVAAGDYYVCIEGAREHGPYELIREPLTLGTGPADKVFQPAGELTAASAAYTV